MATPSREDVLKALGSVPNPRDARGRSLLETGVLGGVEMWGDELTLTVDGKGWTADQLGKIQAGVQAAMKGMEGVGRVSVKASGATPGAEHVHEFAEGDPHAHDHGHDHGHDHDHGHGDHDHAHDAAHDHGHAHGNAHDHAHAAHGDPHAGPRPSGVPTPQPIPGVDRIISVASGKGGVGKSTVAVNLALALVHRGHAVGLLDCDVYGPSIPLLLGVEERPGGTPDGKIAPIKALGLSLMSIGFFSKDNQPMIWRGPIVLGVVSQFLSEVDWGKLDFLVVDMPPGTGDASLTLVQKVPVTGAVIVTTPSDVALIDSQKGLNMYKRVNVPVLGIVENMAWFECDGCGHREHIFGEGLGRKAAEELRVPFLGEIPLDPAVRAGGDRSRPVVSADPEGAAARPFLAVADRLLEQLGMRPGDAAPAKRKGLFSVFKR